jgi:hypothetical protein
MSDFREYKKSLVIIPNSLLGRIITLIGQKNRLAHDILFSWDGVMRSSGILPRLYEDRFGGLILYFLGVRTVGDVEWQERQRRLRDSPNKGKSDQ